MQVLVLGQPGEEVSLELILRVVADVGLVVSVAFLIPFAWIIFMSFFLCFYSMSGLKQEFSWASIVSQCTPNLIVRN